MGEVSRRKGGIKEVSGCSSHKRHKIMLGHRDIVLFHSRRASLPAQGGKGRTDQYTSLQCIVLCPYLSAEGRQHA